MKYPAEMMTMSDQSEDGYENPSRDYITPQQTANLQNYHSQQCSVFHKGVRVRLLRNAPVGMGRGS
jgi:hypothetical protein